MSAFPIYKISLGIKRISHEGTRRVIIVPKRIAKILDDNGIEYAEVILLPIDQRPSNKPQEELGKNN